jgi:hypothetical protein
VSGFSRTVSVVSGFIRTLFLHHDVWMTRETFVAGRTIQEELELMAQAVAAAHRKQS